MSTASSRRLFTVHDYHQMANAGILSAEDRVELIRGDVLVMSPIGPPHNGTVMRASNTLVRLVGDRAIVGVQGAVRLGQYDEPQPDLFLLRPREDFYTTRHAGPSEIFLIIEVADASLEYDRTVKASIYAAFGIPEYWVADLIHDCVWAHTDLQNQTYCAVRECHRGETIVPQLLPDCPVRIEDVLP